MKHIRLFEGFSKEGYYLKISSDEYDPAFTSDRKCLNNYIPFEEKYYSKLIEMGFEHWSSTILGCCHKRVFVNWNGTIDVYIYQKEDEYFDVEMKFDFTKNSRFYRCDQFEGLTKLLKDKNII